MRETSSRLHHVARVITWLPPGGIEKRLTALLPRLNQPPFRVTVVCLRERGALADELERAGVPVVTLPLRSRLSPRGLARLARWFWREQVDLVHSHMYRSNVPATLAARAAGIRAVLCQVHNIGTWETWRQRWLDRWLLRWRSAMIAVSEEVKRDIVTNLHCPPERVRVLYNGVDLSEYERAVRSPALLRQLGVPDGRLVVVVLARLVEQKGHLRLLRALESVRANLPPCHVLFVGEGGMRETLEREIRQRRLDDFVALTGHRADVPAILASSDLSVLPSDREGFSNAIVESLAAGVPVVATDVGGTREAILSGECGWLVRPDDPEALGRAIQTILRDGAMRQRMSQAARLRARRFSLDQMLDDTRNLYQDVLNGWSDRRSHTQGSCSVG